MDNISYGESNEEIVKLAEEAIGYTFKDKEYLLRGLTHSSFAHIHKRKDNERLEFLGDSILNFVVAEQLVNGHKNFTEGNLSKIRANIVSTNSLYETCFAYNINKFAFFSFDKKSGIVGRKIYADIVEAIIGAIYIDGGMEAAKSFILRTMGEKISNVSIDSVYKEDVKTALQEYVQKYKLGSVEYELVKKTGEDHHPIFTESCKIGGKNLSEGSGQNKKEAQRDAAGKALKLLRERAIETQKA